MEIVWWVLAGIALVVLVLTLLGRRALRPGVDPTQLTFDPALMAQVRALAVSGQKVLAIKTLRDGTPGLGLASAKAMVDRMTVRPATGAAQPASAEQTPVTVDDHRPSAQSVSLETELAARSLVAEGKKINAVKLVRESTGWGLAEAKTFVDRL